MKKLIIALMVCMAMAAPAQARGGWHGGWHGGGFHYHTHHHGGRHFGNVVLGTLAGVALADAIVASTRPRVVQVQQPKVYIAEPENKCYTVVSRKKGTVTRQCVSDTDDHIIYVD